MRVSSISGGPLPPAGLSPCGHRFAGGRSTIPAHFCLLSRRDRKFLLRSLPSGPREIRTLGLLNAIETRSQLRYGPIHPFVNHHSTSVRVRPSGPGGIRTLGLFSAIEARSQLRYRPEFYGDQILHHRFGDVKLLVVTPCCHSDDHREEESLG
jgi:hypothetical protein